MDYSVQFLKLESLVWKTVNSPKLYVIFCINVIIFAFNQVLKKIHYPEKINNY